MSRLSYKTLFIILFFLLIPVVFLLKINQKSTQTLAAWWNDAWMYRQSINISSHTSTESNVYITTTINIGDTSKSQNDDGDFRFTDAGGNLLPYYIVSGTGTTAITFHIQLDSFPSGAQTLYAYYGNPTAPNGFSASDFSTAASNYTIGSLGTEETGGAPVAWWKFDEGVGTTAYDSSNNKTDLYFVGTTTPAWASSDKCIAGSCLQFFGNNSYLQSKTSYNFDPANGPFTVSLWFKANSFSTPDAPELFKFNLGTSAWIDLRVGYSNELEFQVRSTDGNTTMEINSPNNYLQENKWYHATVIYDPTGTSKMYINGQQMSNTSNTNVGTLVKDGPITIGRGFNAWEWNGYIDDFKIFSYARSAAQVQADYSAGLAGQSTPQGSSANFGSSSNKSLSDGLVGYWKFDEGTGTTSADSSGNNNIATLTSSTAPSWNGGKYGSGIYLNPGGYVSMGSSVPDPGTNSFSVSFWAKVNSATNDWMSYFIDAGNWSSGQTFEITPKNAILRFGGVTYYRPYTTIIDNSWHHLVAVYDRQENRIKVYRDGIKDPAADTDISAIGSGAINPDSIIGIDYPFHGSGTPDATFDEVRIYNRALSSTEVSALYNYAPGPIVYYKFDEGSGSTAYDSSGNSKNGIFGIGSSAPSWTTGKYGKSLSFDGSNDLVDSGNVSQLNGVSQLTLNYWIKINTNCSSDGVIQKGIGGSPYTFFTECSSNYLLFGTNGSTWATLPTMSVGQWHYLSFVYDGSQSTNALKLTAYIDGVKQTLSFNGTFPSSLGSNNSSLIIGGYPTIADRMFKGQLDDIKIYDYTRTQEQILQDMQGDTTSTKIAGPIAWYKFDEGQGTIAHNSGNGASALNGTISSATWTDGKNNKALNFVSSNTSRVRIPITSTNGLDIKGALSYSVWFKRNSTTDYQTLIDMDDSCTSAETDGYFLRFYNTNLYFYGSINNTTGTDPFTLTYSDPILFSDTTNWHHASVTWDGTTNTNSVKMYIDGKLVAQTTATATAALMPSLNGSNLTVGTLSCNSHAFNGLIDDVKIYNYALSSDEIKQDYNQGSSTVFGQSTQNIGGTVTSLNYCVPGSTDPCSPPVGEWNFEEGTGTTAYDTSGNGNNGTFGTGSSAPTWTTGKIGKALSFNGNDYVITNLLAGIPPMTISLWAKGTSGNILHQGTDEGNYRHYLNVNSNTLAWSYYDGSNKIVSTVWDSSKWNFITLVHTGLQLQLYVNNILSSTLPANSSSSYGVFRMGIRGLSLSPWNGSVDQVRLYNYARTPAQIAWDYNQGAPVAWWKFDECQGTISHDSSGIGNNGSINIGASGTQGSAGTCTTSGTAWSNGASGKINSSLNFDGSDDYISIPDPSSGILDSNAATSLTMSAWLKTSDTSGTYHVILEKGGFGAYNRYSLFYMNTGNIGILLGNSIGLQSIFTTNTTVNDGKWHHITGIIDKTNNLVKIYIDGILKSNVALTRTGSFENSNALNIGGPSPFFANGQIDDVRIYNYALTSTQIKTLYNGGSINFN